METYTSDFFNNIDENKNINSNKKKKKRIIIFSVLSVVFIVVVVQAVSVYKLLNPKNPEPLSLEQQAFLEQSLDKKYPERTDIVSELPFQYVPADLFVNAESAIVVDFATQFFHWLIVRQFDKSIVANIVSLSSNVKNCFSVNEKKHFVVFSYGDDYFFEEDEDKIPIEEQDYILRDSLILCKKNVFYIKNK